MNGWIASAARTIFVAWVADAHDDEESEFDAGDCAAGPGDDWFYTVPIPEERPEMFDQWGTHLSWADAWLAAHVLASRLYASICERRSMWQRAADLPTMGPRAFYVDLWLAIYHDDTGVCVSDHAGAAAMVALGHGVDEPPPVGGMPWPSGIGSSIDCEPNPLR